MTIESILPIFYRLLGALAIILVLAVNPYTFSLASQDGSLEPITVERIQKVQVGFVLVGLINLALGWLVNTAYVRKALSERTGNILLSTSLFIFLLVCAEGILFIRYSANYSLSITTPIAIGDTHLGHVLNPKLDHTYRINRLGFRGEDFNVQKQADEIRIFCVGDSITFGWGLPDENSTYPKKLQSLLDEQEAKGKYTVVNAGVPSYTSLQALRFIDRIMKYGPDLIILCVGWNDLSRSYREDWSRDILLGQSFTIRSEGAFSPAIFRATEDLRSRLENTWNSREIDDDKSPAEIAVLNYRQNLHEIVHYLRDHGVEIVILNLPTVFSSIHMSEAEISLARSFTDVQDLQLFQSVIDDTCESLDVQCLLSVFDLKMTDKYDYFYDHCHPVEKGTSVIAEEILRFLEIRSLIE